MADLGQYFTDGFVNLEDHDKYMKADPNWNKVCTIVHNTIADWHSQRAFIDCGRYSEFARCIFNQLEALSILTKEPNNEQ